jgi:hypothetical protein
MCPLPARRTVLHSACILLGGALAGCLDDGGDAGPPTEQPAGSPSPSPSPTGTPTETPTDSPSPTCPAQTPEEAEPIFIRNGTGTKRTVWLEIERQTDGAPVLLLDERYELGGTSYVQIDDGLFTEAGTYTVRFSVEPGQPDPREETISVDEFWRGSAQLWINVESDDDIEFGVVHVDPTPTKSWC